MARRARRSRRSRSPRGGCRPGSALLVARRVEGDGDLPLGLARALPDDRRERVVVGPLSLAALHHLISGRLGSPLSRPLLVAARGRLRRQPVLRARDRARARDATTAGSEPLPVPRSARRAGRRPGRGRSRRRAHASRSRPPRSRSRRSPRSWRRFDGEGDARARRDRGGGGGRAGLRARPDPVHAPVARVGRLRDPQRPSGGAGCTSASRRWSSIPRSVPATSRSARQRGGRGRRRRDRARRGAGRSARRTRRPAADLLAASARLTPSERTEELTRRRLGEAAARLAAGDVETARTLAEAETRSPVASLRGQAHYLLGEVAWISGSGPPGTHFEAALAAAPADRDSRPASTRSSSASRRTIPRRAVEHAEAAMRVLEPGPRSRRRSPRSSSTGSGRSSALGHGPRWDLFEQWRELEAKAGPDAPKTPLPLICFWASTTSRLRAPASRVEEQWYRERGEDLWRAERLAHLSMVELRAGRWDLAERLVEEACDALAQQLDKPGPWGARSASARSSTPTPAGPSGARATMRAVHRRGGARGARGLGGARPLDARLRRVRRRRPPRGRREPDPDAGADGDDRHEGARARPERAVPRRVAGRAGRARARPRGARAPRGTRAQLPAGSGSTSRSRARARSSSRRRATSRRRSPRSTSSTSTRRRSSRSTSRWNRLVQGRLHRRVKQRRAAADALGEALAIFERLGAPTWAEQARAELGRVGLRRAPDELTPTERRVAELAATGMTNREVASAAFMSPKTVEANLARVYRKLGIASRAELGARMHKSRRTPDYVGAGRRTFPVVADGTGDLRETFLVEHTGRAWPSTRCSARHATCARARAGSSRRERRSGFCARPSCPATSRSSACSRRRRRSSCARRTRLPGSRSTGSRPW